MTGTVTMRPVISRITLAMLEDTGCVGGGYWMVGFFCSLSRQLVRFSHLNLPFFQNSEFVWNIVPEAVITGHLRRPSTR